MSGTVREHGYWGSARDRIPRSQTDDLVANGTISLKKSQENCTFGRLVSVTPHENLCLLRSGQDWGDTDTLERNFYIEKIVPPLEAGMLEIRDQGLDFGCLFNRYMHIVEGGEQLDKTYSLSAWYSISEIEAWVKAETHLEIFRAGINHYSTVGGDAKLRLYHEMSIIRAKDQSFEYFNCHPATGMLKAAIS